MKTNDIRTLIDEQRKANQEFNAFIESVNSNKNLTNQGKKSEIEKARSKYNEERTTRGNSVAESLLAYKKGYKKGVDLSDPTMTNVLNLVGMLGKDTPVSVLNEATKHFRDNQEALKTISTVLKAKEVPYSKIDQFIIDDKTIDDAILEAQKGFNDPSSLSPIGIAMAHIEGVEGATIIEEPVQPSSLPLIF